MSDVTLTSAVRSNLLSLQNTRDLVNRTQGRLSTGLKVASPMDDAVSYFQAKGLSDRASDFSDKKSGIDQGISTVSSALNGIDGVQGLVTQLKGLALNAKTATSTQISALVSQFNDLRTQIDNLANDTSYQGLNLIAGTGSTLSVDFSTSTASSLTVNSVDVTTGLKGLDINKAVTANGTFDVSYGSSTQTTVSAGGTLYLTYAGTATNLASGTITMYYNGTQGAAITLTVGVSGTSLTACDFTTTQTFAIGDTIAVRTGSAGGPNENRVAVSQSEFSVEFGGNTSVNLLQSGNASITLTFAVSSQYTFSKGLYTFSYGGSTISVQVGSAGDTTKTFTNTQTFASNSTLNVTIASDGLGTAAIGVSGAVGIGAAGSSVTNVSATFIVSAASFTGPVVQGLLASGSVTVGAVTGQTVLDSKIVAQITSMVSSIDLALQSIRSKAQTLGSNVAVLQTRLDFTKNYVNTLTAGSGKLNLADLNEEGANLLALQTRQSLGIQALSFAGQAEQSILQLFR
jgi:flagellin-like hook-associated protein FlgL